MGNEKSASGYLRINKTHLLEKTRQLETDVGIHPENRVSGVLALVSPRR